MSAKLWWKVLAGFGIVMLAVTALAASVQVGIAIADRDPGIFVRAAVGAGFSGLFWWWITAGALARTRPDPDAERAEVDRIGPWGVVGRLLLCLIVLGAGALAILGWRDARRSADATRAARAEAESIVYRRHITAKEVADAKADQATWLYGASKAELDRGEGPLQQLFPLADGEVIDAAMKGRDALVLIRTPHSPPCVVLEITSQGAVATHTTTRCT